MYHSIFGLELTTARDYETDGGIFSAGNVMLYILVKAIYLN